MLTNTQKDYRVCTIVADQIALPASLILAIALRAWLPKNVPFDWLAVLHGTVALRQVGLAVLWYFSMSSTGAYELSPTRQGWGLWRAAKGTSIFTLVALAIAFFQSALFSRGAILVFVCIGIVMTVTFRHVALLVYNRLFPSAGNMRVLLLADKEGAGEIQTLFSEAFRCRAVLRTLPRELIQNASSELLEKEVERILDEVKPDELVIAHANANLDALGSILNICDFKHIPWHFVPTLNQLVFGNSRTHVLGTLPLISAKSANLSEFSFMVKRVVDVILSTLSLLCVLPIMAAIWLAVKFTSPGPALFVQQRVGRSGKVFNLYKFRTMTVNQDQGVHKKYASQWISNEAFGGNPRQKVYKIVGDKRITPLGTFLRKYSLDELPQIFNVLKGDMSLVGPRPALSYEVELYKEWHKERLVGIPGLTGEWQVGGRNDVSFDEMVKLDLEYLRNWTAFRDIKVLLKTVPYVLLGTGK